MFGYCRQRNWQKPPNSGEINAMMNCSNAPVPNSWLTSRQGMQHRQEEEAVARQSKQNCFGSYPQAQNQPGLGKIMFVPGRFDNSQVHNHINTSRHENQRGEKRAPPGTIHNLYKKYKKEKSQTLSFDNAFQFESKHQTSTSTFLGHNNSNGSFVNAYEATEPLQKNPNKFGHCTMHGNMHCNTECKMDTDVSMDESNEYLHQEEAVRSQANTEYFTPRSNFVPEYELLGSGFDIYDR